MSGVTVSREWFIDTLSQCGVEDDELVVTRRAMEILRLLNVKIPVGSQVFKNGEQCRPGVALELAWREIHKSSSLDRRKVAKSSMCLPRIFECALGHAEKMIRKEKNEDVVDVGFLASSLLGGRSFSGQIAQRSRELLERRHVHLREKGRSGDGQGDKAITAAAFFEVATRSFDADIEARALLALIGGVSVAEFRRAREEVSDLFLQETRSQPPKTISTALQQSIPDKQFASLRAQHAVRFAESNTRKRPRPDSSASVPLSLPSISEEEIEDSDDDSEHLLINNNHPPLAIWARDVLRKALGSEPPPFTSLDAIQSAFDALLATDESTKDNDSTLHPRIKRQRAFAAAS